MKSRSSNTFVILLLAAILLCALRGYSQAISLFGGMSFSPSPLRVSEGKEMQDPLTIRIVGTNDKGELVAAKDSGVPVAESFDPKTGKLGSEMYTHAVNVVWQFAKAGITFEAEGVTHKAEKAGATISFTKNGVKMESISTGKAKGNAAEGPDNDTNAKTTAESTQQGLQPGQTSVSVTGTTTTHTEAQAPQRAHARHILVAVAATDSPEAKKTKLLKAEDIRRQLLNGADFSETARKFSDCPSKARGGDLGVFTKGVMVKPFEDAAFTQNVGEIGPVVETPFGYHIIQVLDGKAQPAPQSGGQQTITQTPNKEGDTPPDMQKMTVGEDSRQAAEQRDWENAKAKNSAEAYYDFLDKHPTTRHVNDAIDALQAVDGDLKDKLPEWIEKGDPKAEQKGAQHTISGVVNFAGYKFVGGDPPIFVEIRKDHLLYFSGKGIIFGNDGTRVLVGLQPNSNRKRVAFVPVCLKQCENKVTCEVSKRLTTEVTQEKDFQATSQEVIAQKLSAARIDPMEMEELSTQDIIKVLPDHDFIVFVGPYPYPRNRDAFHVDIIRISDNAGHSLDALILPQNLRKDNYYLIDAKAVLDTLRNFDQR